MIGDSGAVFVISDGDLYAGLDTQDAMLPPQIDIYESDLLQQLESLPDGVIAPSERIAPLQPDHLAYLIYTSGSTGVPKGTAIEHQSILNYLFWARDFYPCDARSGAPINTSITFDGTKTPLWTPLVSGSHVRFYSDTDDIEGLAKLLNQKLDFSLVKLTPTHLDVLCNNCLLYTSPSPRD